MPQAKCNISACLTPPLSLSLSSFPPFPFVLYKTTRQSVPVGSTATKTLFFQINPNAMKWKQADEMR